VARFPFGVQDEMPIVDGEAATVTEAEEPLTEALRESILPDQRVEDQPAEGLRQELLEHLVVVRPRYEFPPRKKRPSDTRQWRCGFH
jgi:hypothetical protein